jgi:hypothetical protein
MTSELTALIGVTVPLAAIVMTAFMVWHKHRTDLAKLQIKAAATESAEKAAQYANGIRALEERVRVLERIVTDKGYDVATQIEALRDARRVEEPKLPQPAPRAPAE